MSMTTAELAELIKIVRWGITALDFRCNKFITLPGNIGDLVYLTKLNLNGNRLSSLPSSIGNLTNLTELYLNGHQFTTLPESIGNLTNLTRLNLNGDRLTSLPNSIQNLKKLTKLNLNSNRLDRIPDFIFTLANLTEINLDGNLLTDLANLKQVPNLKINRSPTQTKFKIVKSNGFTKIYIGDRYIETILNDLSNFTNLVALNLNSYGLADSSEHLSIDKILADLSKLPNLTSLNWHVDLFPYLPILKIIPKLEFIGFSGIVLNRYKLYNIVNLGRINLYNSNRLICLPNSIGDFKNITEIELSYSLLSILPESIVNLKNLTKLDLIHNQLTSLPDNIACLTKLTSLNLRGNKLKSIPYTIDYLVHLFALNLSNNQLKILPNSIGSLPQLASLDLRNNQLTELPDRMSDLKKLTSLNLTGNPLTDLSMFKKLPNLKQLRFLDVDLPRRYWTKFSEWKPEWLLDENNAEIRRTLIDRVGYDKICQALKAVKLDTWREYTLLKIDNIEPVYNQGWNPIGREPIVLLKMICPSTHHVHILRVPPEMRNAETAIVWVNHGIHPDDIAVQT